MAADVSHQESARAAAAQPTAAGVGIDEDERTAERGRSQGGFGESGCRATSGWRMEHRSHRPVEGACERSGGGGLEQLRYGICGVRYATGGSEEQSCAPQCAWVAALASGPERLLGRAVHE